MTDTPSGRLDPATGRARDVTVTLTGLSFRSVADGGRHFPYDDFGPDFIEAVHGALLAPRRRGMIRSTLVCPLCETSLDGTVVGAVSVSTEIALTRIPPIWVDLEMPGITCPGCRRALVRIDDRALDSDLSDALIGAMTTAGLSPG